MIKVTMNYELWKATSWGRHAGLREGRVGTDSEAIGEVVQAVTHDDHPGGWRDRRRRWTVLVTVTMMMMMMMMMMMILVITLWWLCLFQAGVLGAERPRLQALVCYVIFYVIWSWQTAHDHYNCK